MSSLDKLAIRGIRSFDNNKLAVVEFQTPVTVIVGSNGTGKTTIIECLKYATTGELPPNTKGGAFVHDPKMAGEKEVKAQVKLRFRNSNHERMVVTRNISVSVKKTGGLTMKTLEGLLSKDEANDANTKRNTISTKCSEIDSEVPRLLGVSQAILENVIFCHQEESNWPLSEPAPLKKKFDEIFEATKFTDALDSIKKIRKDRTADLKVEKEKLNHLKSEKDRSESIKIKLAKLDQSISAKQAAADSVGQRAQELAQANVQFRERAGQFSEVFTKQEQLKHQISVWEEQIAGYEDSITLLKESEEELRAQIRTFDRELERKKAEKVEKLNRKADQEDVLRGQERERSALVQRRGQLIGEKTSHENAVKNREETAKDVCRNYDIKGYDYSPLEKVKVDEIVDKLRDLHRSQDALVKKMKDDAKSREEEVQAELTKLRTAKATEVGSRTSLQRQIDEVSRTIRADVAETQNQVASALESDLIIGKQNLETDQKNLVELEAAITEATYDERKKQLRLEVAQKEAEREGFNAEFANLNQYSEIRATRNIKSETRDKKQALLTANIDGQRSAYRKLVGKDINLHTIERDVAAVANEKDIEIGRAERDKVAADRKLSQIESAITQEHSSIKEKERELHQLEQAIKAACETAGAKTVEDGITTADEEINLIQEELQDAVKLPALFEKILEYAHKHRKCLGCDRGIADGDEATRVTAYATSKRDRFRQRFDQTDTLKRELADWEQTKARFLQLQPSVEKVARLRQDEIPGLRDRAEAKQATLEVAKTEAEKSASIVSDLKSEQRDLINLKQLASSIAKWDAECKELTQEISDIDMNLSLTGSTRTAKIVEADLARIAGEIKTTNQSLSNLGQEQESKNRQVAAYRNSIHSKTMDDSRKRAQLQKFKVVEERLAESRRNVEELKAQLKILDDKIAAADQPIRKLQDELKSSQEEHTNELFIAEQGILAHNESIQALERANQAVDAWTTSRGPARLRQLEDDLSRKEAELKDTRDAINSYEGLIRLAENDVHQSDKNKKNIQDNIRQRAFKSQVENAQREMSELNVEEATIAREQYEHRYGKSRQKETDLNAQHATLIGEMSSLRAQALELRDTLSSEYKNIKSDFMAKLIEVKTSDLALVDLEKYAKALDNAIMRYHAVKMAEINDNLKHLWNKTYQGTDIDGLIIKSDSDEGSTTSKAATTRKSYNYRVVMVKDQVEMDMRGRCSAGQKVLASIIIRLALSDSFGHNCGIIALDEPTTNLDRDNIRSLATSLAAIIEERKNSGNFQLVVITHDETFLKELSMADGLDYFMRVSRDNHQKSIVTRHRISHLN